MWPFKRKKISLEQSGTLRGFTDCHSHILPGVDDGVKTLRESLAILAKYEDLGISDLWLTPHIMEDIPNTRMTSGGDSMISQRPTTDR